MSTFHYNFHELFKRGGFVFAVQVVDGNDQTFGDVVSWQPFFPVRPWFRNKSVESFYTNGCGSKCCSLQKTIVCHCYNCVFLFDVCNLECDIFLDYSITNRVSFDQNVMHSQDNIQINLIQYLARFVRQVKFQLAKNVLKHQSTKTFQPLKM